MNNSKPASTLSMSPAELDPYGQLGRLGLNADECRHLVLELVDRSLDSWRGSPDNDGSDLLSTIVGQIRPDDSDLPATLAVVFRTSDARMFWMEAGDFGPGWEDFAACIHAGDLRIGQGGAFGNAVSLDEVMEIAEAVREGRALDAARAVVHADELDWEDAMVLAADLSFTVGKALDLQVVSPGTTFRAQLCVRVRGLPQGGAS